MLRSVSPEVIAAERPVCIYGEICSLRSSPPGVFRSWNDSSRGSPREQRPIAEKAMAIERMAGCAGPGHPPSRPWSVCPMYSLIPQSRPPSRTGHTRYRARYRKDSVAPGPRELTSENSPHTTNQSRKIKIDRAAAKIIVGTRVAGKEARSCRPWTGRRIGWISFREQLELLRDVIRRCLGKPTKPIDQAMDSVLDGYGGMEIGRAHV